MTLIPFPKIHKLKKKKYITVLQFKKEFQCALVSQYITVLHCKTSMEVSTNDLIIAFLSYLFFSSYGASTLSLFITLIPGPLIPHHNKRL